MGELPSQQPPGRDSFGGSRYVTIFDWSDNGRAIAKSGGAKNIRMNASASTYLKAMPNLSRRSDRRPMRRSLVRARCNDQRAARCVARRRGQRLRCEELVPLVARLWRRSFARTRGDALDATGGLAADSQRPSTASLGPDIFKKRLGYRVSYRSRECKSQRHDNRLDLVRGGHL